MYYDPDGPVRTAAALPAPFRVDFVTGGDADAGCVSGAEVLPLSQLYFCDSCSRIVSKRDLAEEVDSYYCPHCLENMPSSEAMLYGMRCSKCWECPVCASTLTMCVASPLATEQSYHLACGCCRWSSKGRLEAVQPEQLVAKIIALERESDPRHRMAALVDAFRTRAQEQQRERELAQRLRRRSSIARGSFTTGALNSFAARRFSSALMLRSARAAAPRDASENAEQEGGNGPWRVDDLEAQLEKQVFRAADLRSDARGVVAAAVAAANAAAEQSASNAVAGAGNSGPEPPASSPSSGKESFISTTSATAIPPTPPAPEVPVLEGLTVDELLRAHVEAVGPTSVLEQLQTSLYHAVDQGQSLSSLAQRLQQVSYGYQGPKSAEARAAEAKVVEAQKEKAKELAANSDGELPMPLRTARAQLETSLFHADTWALLPVRKPLLTRRSRRCRLLNKSITKVEDSESSEPQRPCKGIVVKPQINPCSNPPFQKNNVAVAYIPRCAPWAWSGASGSGEGGVAKMAAPAAAAAAAAAIRGPRPRLKAGETAELVFAMVNPLAADVEVSIDPTIGNPQGDEPSAFSTSHPGLAVLVAEQNVEVLTGPFTTIVAKFNELADLHDTISAEDADRMKALKENDDADVIPDRKLHKVLVRLRFKAGGTPESAAELGPWVFYAQLCLKFMDESSNQHQVTSVLRFGTEATTMVGPAPGELDDAAQR